MTNKVFLYILYIVYKYSYIMNTIFAIYIIYILDTLLALLLKDRLGRGFVVPKFSLFYKNMIFMCIEAETKKRLKDCNEHERIKIFRELLIEAFNNLNVGITYKTVTHRSIIKRIEKMHKEGKLEIIKCKKTLPRPMIFNKLAIKNYNGLFEWEQFYKIYFKKLRS